MVFFILVMLNECVFIGSFGIFILYFFLKVIKYVLYDLEKVVLVIKILIVKVMIFVF